MNTFRTLNSTATASSSDIDRHISTLLMSVSSENPIMSKNRKASCVAMLHALEMIYTLSTNFVCKLCRGFMIDICTFPCGHMFCKFCALSSLRQLSSCPHCLQEAFQPFATRCYEIDSAINEFYPIVWKFYLKLEESTEIGRELVRFVPLARNGLGWISASQKDLDGKVMMQLHSPSDRVKLRDLRRLISERKDILLQAPCTSILEKLGTLGWGTSQDEQSIQYGMQALVWFALCYALWNFTYVFQHPYFDSGLRTFIYSVVLLVVFNIIQRYLFVNPEFAPNLLDFELWEWSDETLGDSTRNALNESTSSAESATTSPDPVLSNHRQTNSGSTVSSNESFMNSENGEMEVQQSLLELEQILFWRKEGSLNLNKMYHIATDILNILGNEMTLAEEFQVEEREAENKYVSENLEMRK